MSIPGGVQGIEITDPITGDILAVVDNTIGQLRKTPVLLYSVFTELLRKMYEPENGLRLDFEYAWDPDDAKTDVWINSEYVWNDSEIDYRPAIYVALSQMQYVNPTGKRSSVIDYSYEESEYTHARRGECSVSFVHVGETAGQANHLLSHTLDLLDAFSDVIAEQFCLSEFSISGVQTPDVTNNEARERLKGAVVANVAWEETWIIKQEAPKLQKIAINAGLGALDMLEYNVKI